MNDEHAPRARRSSFIVHRSSFVEALSSIADRRVILIGGKGGVGKTTIAKLAADELSKTRRVVSLDVAALDAEALYRKWLDKNLDAFLELGDRGTYLDRDELRRFFELSLPGVDELMAWMRIGELAEENPDAIVVVDTTPTGHALRMLASGEHFRQFAEALEAMQEKHRGIVRQLARREVRDAMDAFIADFEAQAERRRELLTKSGAFVPVMLNEPWVIEQTRRLIAEVRAVGIDVPFVVLNRASEAIEFEVPIAVVPFQWRTGASPVRTGEGACPPLRIAHLTFFAGKGGVGKTTSASSLALKLARANPEKRYVIISVDPAHSLRDVFAHEAPPPNLQVEIVDTRAKWREFRDTIGREIERAMNAITPGGLTVAYDTDAMQKLVEIAPPGADELFAITRLADLAADESIETVIVDTAPTGHFLRLLDLPRTAGEWVREFMRILLRYKELIPAGSLGEELIRASRALHVLDDTLHSDRTSVIVVMRREPVIAEETERLIAELKRRKIPIGGVKVIEPRPKPPVTLDELASLS
jgi:arsenite/tail-anchored protein-transporting ATPase